MHLEQATAGNNRCKRELLCAFSPQQAAMDAVYWSVFAVLAAVVAGLLFTQNKEGSIVPASGPLVATFLKLRNNYLLVYSLMMGALRVRVVAI